MDIMRRYLPITLILAAFTASGCGDGGGGQTQGAPNFNDPPVAASPPATSAPATKTADAAKATVEDYFGKGFGDNPASACALLTPEYQQKQIADSAQFGKAATTCEQAVKAGAAYIRALGFADDLTQFTNATVSGDKASVLSVSEPPFEDTRYNLVWDGSRWLIAGDESAPETAGDPERWLANWCKVMTGTTVGQAVALMGNFTGDFQEGDGGGQVEWSQSQYSFTAFLAGGEISQLYANPSELTPADKSKLRCASTRD